MVEGSGSINDTVEDNASWIVLQGRLPVTLSAELPTPSGTGGAWKSCSLVKIGARILMTWLIAATVCDRPGRFMAVPDNLEKQRDFLF